VAKVTTAACAAAPLITGNDMASIRTSHLTGRAGRRAGPLLRGALGIMLAAGALAACEGENLFTDGGSAGHINGSLPVVTIERPSHGDSHPLSDSILVRVRVKDGSGITEVRMRGFSIRGDSLQNTTVVDRYAELVVPFPQPAGARLPKDTVIQRFLRPVASDTNEPVFIVATAKNAGGNVKADTVRITAGPRVEIIEPLDGQTVGVQRIVGVRVVAHDPAAGLDRVSLLLSMANVRSDSIVLPLSGRTALDTVLQVNTGQNVGTLSLQATARNRQAVVSSSALVRLTVSSTAATDVVPPQVLRVVESAARVELGDSIRITVRATDGTGTGIARMGAVVTARPDGGLPARQFHLISNAFSPPLSGMAERTFHLVLGQQYSETEAAFPRTFALEVHAFAVDAAGNAAASVGTSLTALPVRSEDIGGERYYAARDASPPVHVVTVTKGRSIRLPDGGRIADAVVDAAQQRVYLSNIQNNKVEIFHLGADTFDITAGVNGRGLVGAAPWGLAISNNGDSLYVANSGGTNISVLPLSGANYMIEDVPRRILTPNTLLFDLTVNESANGLRYTGVAHDFSDRPQFVAQHSTGTLVYSTLPTPASRDGTIRYADTNAGPLPEVYLLHRGAVRNADKTFAIANIDSLKIGRALGADDRVILYDRLPGTQTVIASDLLFLDQAVVDIRGKGSDIEVFAGAWDVPRVALGDTTFVAISSNRETIAFGEGAVSPYGRIFLCCTISAEPPFRLGVSSDITVGDLVGNAAERVFGVGLNDNGSLGVARGTQAAYFFSRDLRLQGEFRGGVSGGAGGASLHPQHASVLEQGDRALAFVATGNRSIKIIDSAHFYERGEIFIRDNVVGPVRTLLPLPDENALFSSQHPNYIIVKLIGVTAGNNVVIVNVRRKDVSN
jgi:DNA-binding beta-propeller fold protein YncE